MPNIGPMELILLGVVAVLLFGPARIPEMARSLGRATREFKDSVTGKDNDELPQGGVEKSESTTTTAASPSEQKS